MSTSQPLPSLLRAATELAREAGDKILEVYAGDFGVERKEDDSPLTAADRAAHRSLLAGLTALTPHIPVLSEEGEIPAYAVRRQWERYWLIDPLDGTREFVKRNGEFTVNIALIEAGRSVLGVVHAPVTATTWFAAHGEGARRLDAAGESEIHTRSLQSPLVAVVSRSHRGERVDALLQRLPPVETVSVGSSLKFCQVAEGRADFYPRFGPTSEWDTAAAQCVVEAAGGRVVKLDLTPLRYNAKESLLNPDFLVFGDVHHDWEQYLHGLHGEER